MTYRHPLFIAAMFLTACSDDPGDGATEANGSAMYRDAATDVDGNSQEPAAPSDDFYMEIRTEGTGTFDVSEPTVRPTPSAATSTRCTRVPPRSETTVCTWPA